LTVVGTRGTLHWDNATGETRWWSDSDADWQAVPAPPGFERNDMFVEEMRHFVEVSEGRAEPICTLADGSQALQIALAARQSAETGRRVELN
jgi:predicted dehydrogenase